MPRHHHAGERIAILRRTILVRGRWGALLWLLLLSAPILHGQSADTVAWRWLLAEPTGNTMHVLHAFDAERGIIAGESGNILRTTDAGATWTTLMEQKPWRWEQSTLSGDNTLWLRADEDQLLVTRDLGATWQTPDALEETWIIHLQFVTPDHGFAVDTGYRLHQTIDGGETWETVIDSLTPSVGVYPRFHFLDDSVWFAGRTADGTLKRTSDAGQTWSTTTGNVVASINTLTFLNDSIGLIGGSGRNLYRTTDRGVTWQKTTSIRFDDIRDFGASDNGYVIAAGPYQAMVSWDYGATWSPDTTGPWRRSAVKEIVDVGGTLWATGTDGIFFVSDDAGRTWRTGQSPDRMEITDLHFIDDRRGFAVGEYDERYAMALVETTDGGESWRTHHAAGEWSSVYAVEIVGSHLWVTADGASILHSPDLGESWEIQSKNAVDVTLHAIDFADSLHGYALGEDVLMRTTDGGVFWEIMPNGRADAEYHGLSVLSADTAWVTMNTTIRRTTDGGESWVDTTMDNDVNAIQFLDARNGWIIMTGKGILRTRDGGGSWQYSHYGGSTFKTFHFHDTLNGVALVASHVWTTDNAGETWIRYPHLNGRLTPRAAFTNEYGIWVAALGGILHAERRIVTAVPPSHQIVTAPRVRPIPAVDHIVLEGLPEERGHWRVTIHSVLGEAVRMIGSVPAEGTSLHVALDDLPAGVYVVRIENEITGSIRYARTVVQ